MNSYISADYSTVNSKRIRSKKERIKEKVSKFQRCLNLSILKQYTPCMQVIYNLYQEVGLIS